MSVIPLRSIYQLKVTLTGGRPPIWRRVLVSSDLSLDQFHLTLQIVMGWTNSQLHQFIANKVTYSEKRDDFDSYKDVEDENQYKLNQLFKAEKDSFIYEYDFGDGWAHKVLLEKILPFHIGDQLPRCIKGKRACPPEDCGGMWGYAELLEAIDDPEHPEHESMLAWLGGNIDAEAFDIDRINELLLEQ